MHVKHVCVEQNNHCERYIQEYTYNKLCRIENTWQFKDLCAINRLRLSQDILGNQHVGQTAATGTGLSGSKTKH